MGRAAAQPQSSRRYSQKKPFQMMPKSEKIGKKKLSNWKKIPKIGNMNKIMDGIFPWDVQSPRSPLGFAGAEMGRVILDGKYFGKTIPVAQQIK